MGLVNEKKRVWIEVSISLDLGRRASDLDEEAIIVDVVTEYIASTLSRGVIVEDETVIKAYLTSKELEGGMLNAIHSFLADLQERHGGYPGFKVDTRPIIEEDWSQGWKAYFKPIKVGERLVVKPTFEEYVPKAGEVVVEIDPGQAFGTGSHATTRLCLRAIEEYFHDQSSSQGISCLDCGTGTGILGIAAAKLGAGTVLMIDVDPVAVEVARKNIELNHVQRRAIASTTPIWEIQDSFHLVVANLDKNTLLLLSEDLARVLYEGGRLIASGILVEQVEAVRRHFEGLGLRTLKTPTDPEDPEWAALVMELPRGHGG